GSCVAFFDLGDNQTAEPSPNTPAWVNHLALRVGSLESLERARARLVEAGVDVIGVTDHGFVRSIYFFDPNGIRVELTTDMEDTKVSESALIKARTSLDARTAEKAARASAYCGPFDADGIRHAPPHPAAQSVQLFQLSDLSLPASAGDGWQHRCPCRHRRGSRAGRAVDSHPSGPQRGALCADRGRRPGGWRQSGAGVYQALDGDF